MAVASSFKERSNCRWSDSHRRVRSEAGRNVLGGQSHQSLIRCIRVADLSDRQTIIPPIAKILGSVCNSLDFQMLNPIPATAVTSGSGALEEVGALRSDAEEPRSPTYDELFRQGKLPPAPAR